MSHETNTLKGARLNLFTGKGGTGKTTCSLSAALFYSSQGEKILIASTDPAHSLLDSLKIEESQRSESLWYTKNLHLLEIDGIKGLEAFKNNNSSVLQEILYRGTYLDREDIQLFFELSLPGLDELIAIITLSEILEKGEYQRIIVDMAPTGHTLQLFDLIDHMEDWLEVLDAMLDKHRYMASVFSSYIPDATDDFIETWQKRLESLKEILVDPLKTQVFPVITPETMSIEETRRMVEKVKKMGLPLQQMIINQVMRAEGDCSFCASRRSYEQALLNKIDNEFQGLEKIQCPLFRKEVKGEKALLTMAHHLFFSKKVSKKTPKREKLAEYQKHPDLLPWFKANSLKKIEERPYILIGGKGGVGKTTIASALGLYLSSLGYKTLIFSMDPAHSLADSFEKEIGDQLTPLIENQLLYGYEMNPAQSYALFKEKYRKEMEEAFEKILGGSGMDLCFDEEVMKRLISLAPPGLDQIMAMIKLMDREMESFDRILLDTAPTGHMLRFLELPHLVIDWFLVFLTILTKYRGVISLYHTKEFLLELKEKIERLKSLFIDPKKTGVLVVTILEKMVISETKRLIQGVERLGLKTQWLVVNRIMKDRDCPFCHSIWREERRYFEEIQDLFSSIPQIGFPLLPREAKGIEELQAISSLLFTNKN